MMNVDLTQLVKQSHNVENIEILEQQKTTYSDLVVWHRLTLLSHTIFRVPVHSPNLALSNETVWIRVAQL